MHYRDWVMTAALMMAAAVGAQPAPSAFSIPAAGVAAVPALADRPRVGPPPTWVLPADIPPPPGAGGAIVSLLNDQQVRFDGDATETFLHLAFRLDSSQVLQAASFNITWDPALETLTVSRYRLIRDGKVIDQLGDGTRLTVVRREPNLEQAALDGRLTATYQPEDVRTGDIVELSLTRVRRDPALAGRSEIQMELAQGQPIARARMRVVWPRAMTLNRRVFRGLPDGVGGGSGDWRDYVIDLKNFTPPRTPDDAPLRYRVADAVEVTNAASWSDVARTVMPLFTEAATLKPGSPLLAEAARIRAASPDPKARATLALKLVQTQVRYLFLGMDGGGYRPAVADVTWSRRFGDCKAKTVLLLGLLKALDIDAEAVLVQTAAGDLLAEVLPRVSIFDHVLVRARIGGKTYWLDGTRPDDTNLEWLKPPEFHYGLPLIANATLEPIAVPALERPQLRQTLDLDARAGVNVPAKASGELRFEGDAAAGLRVSLRQLSAVDRQRSLKEAWRKEYAFVDPETVDATDDNATGALVMTMTGTARMDWGAGTPYRYEADGAVVGFTLRTARDVELEKDAPFAVGYPYWQEYRQTILLPNGGRDFTVEGGDVDRTIGAYALKRSVKLVGDRFTLSASTRTVADQMLAATAIAAVTPLRDLATGAVHVRAPGDYTLTPGDKAALQAAIPTTADALLARGIKLYEADDIKGAEADLDAALKLDPRLARALGLKAFISFYAKRDDAAALAAQALAIDPEQWNALYVRGSVSAIAKRLADAERDFTAAAKASPKWTTPLLARALVRADLKLYDAALADVAVYAEMGGDAGRAAAARVGILQKAGRGKEALAVLDALLVQHPNDAAILYLRSKQKLSGGDRPGAIADLTLLAAATPKSPAALIERSQLWPPADRAHWMADIDEAMRRALPGDVVSVWKARSVMEERAGEDAAALASLDKAARADPTDTQVDLIRLEILRKSKGFDPAMGIATIQKLVDRKPGNAYLLNSLCWTRATANLQLDMALANCEAALKIAPGSAAYLDSRAFVRLRMKQYDLAIADYDAALSTEPAQSASLYGRGLARLGKGDNGSAAADFAAARKLSPQIDATFAGYGMAAPDAKKREAHFDAIPAIPGATITH